MLLHYKLRFFLFFLARFHVLARATKFGSSESYTVGVYLGKQHQYLLQIASSEASPNQTSFIWDLENIHFYLKTLKIFI